MPRVMPSRLAMLILAVHLGLGTGAALAEEPNLSASPDGAPGAVTRLVLADALWRQGLASGEWLYLLTAIRLARSVTLQPASGWERQTVGEPQNGPATGAFAGRAAAPDLAGAAALAILRNLAEEDPMLRDLVYDLDAQIPRSPAATAVFAEADLAPGQTDAWRIVLYGEVPAELGVIGDGDSLLGLSLRDQTGAELCAVPPSPGRTLCRVTPAQNGFFTLSVQTSGTKVNRYRLIGN